MEILIPSTVEHTRIISTKEQLELILADERYDAVETAVIRVFQMEKESVLRLEAKAKYVG